LSHEEIIAAYARHSDEMSFEETRRQKSLKVMVVGLGETGRSLLEIIRGIHETVGWDLKSEERFPYSFKPDILHICFPFSDDFKKEVLNYIRVCDPVLTIIESTVPPGTTRSIWDFFKTKLIVHSPIRGNIRDGMKWGLFAYTKFIGPMTDKAGYKADSYYQSLGFKTRVCENPEDTELMKILNTTYYGLCIAWFQEMRRIAERFNVEWEDVVEFIRTTEEESGGKVPRPIYYPGFIGGHCVIPNAELLNRIYPSKFIEALLESNKKRGEELAKD